MGQTGLIPDLKLGAARPLPVHLEDQATHACRCERLLLFLAAGFVGLSSITYALVAERGSLWSHLWPALVWAVCLATAHLLLNRLMPLRDPLLLPVVGLLTGWGLILVDRLAPNFLARQTLWVALGTVAMLTLALYPPPRPGDPAGLRWLRRYRLTWLLGGLALLALTLVFGVNPSGEGLRFWLGGRLPLLGGVFFQPSELLKLLAVAYLASYMAEKQGLIGLTTIRLHLGRRHLFDMARPPMAYLAPLLLMWGLSLTLLAWQRDLGAAVLFFVVFMAMLYLASGRWEAVLSGLALLVGMILLAYFLPLEQLAIVRLRVDTWLDPWPEAQGRAFQIVQSLLALASGGLVGQGVGQGYPTYVPVVHSDFAFSALVEEWGLVGGLTAVAGLTTLVYRGFRLALLARRGFSSFLAAGLAALIGVQSLIILAGITRLLPLTGITLPFLSYGGSSLLTSMMIVGLLLKVSGEQT